MFERDRRIPIQLHWVSDINVVFSPIVDRKTPQHHLAFFYGYVELLKSKRSFVVQSLKSIPKGFSTPKLLQGSKHLFLDFADGIIREGIDKSELTDRRFFTEKYKNALWIQFVFILNFWSNDDSAGFEKSDEAIEKGINVTFDLFQRTPIDSMVEFGKFIFTNGRK